METTTSKRRRAGATAAAAIALLIGLALASPAGLKIKVTTDAASLKVSPDAGASVLVRLPLNTVLQAESKEGEWYKVLFEISPGNRVVAYIQDQLVAPVDEAAAPPDKSVPAPEKPAPVKEPAVKEFPANPGTVSPDRAQADIVADIQSRLDRCRSLIRQGGAADEVLNLLSPLAARALRVADRGVQQQVTTEIFFLRGLAYASKSDDSAARREFRNMFEASETEARTLVRNIFDARIVALLKLAEGEYMGLVTEYTLEIVSDPPGAKVKADGRDLGAAPAVYRTQTPKVLIELEKDGYRPVREDVDLAQPSTRKSYHLTPASFDVPVRSTPTGAKIFLDGKDTGGVTNGELRRLPAGPHQVRLTKEFYADAQAPLDLREGAPNAVDVVLVVASYATHGVWGGIGSPFFENPAAIAVDPAERIIVVDESPARLKIFNGLGEVIGGGGKIALGLADLVKPAGVAANAEAIYVADAETHALLKLDATGHLQAKWGTFGSAADGLNTPMGLALDGEGNVFVADSGNARVKKYSPSGEVLASWGRSGSGDGEFLSPRAVALAAAGDVFVLDARRVQKFSPKGEYLASWGRLGSGDGEFRNPLGLCVDAAGSVYVADAGNHRIQKFDAAGRLICAWGSNGKDSGLFDQPAGIAVDAAGIVYVVDRNNQRIQLFAAGAGALGGAEPHAAAPGIDHAGPLSRPGR